MLSKFGAGDTRNVDLSIDDSDGHDGDGRREVKEYAERITAGGWELILVKADTLGWHNPNGYGTYKLEKRKAGWHGTTGTREVDPQYTDDLQQALDAAGEYMAENPVDQGDSA